MIPHFHFQKITLPTYWTINHKGKRRGRKMEFIAVIQVRDSLVAQTVKTLPAMKEMRFSPWVRKIPGEGHGHPLQYSCLENPLDGGAWQASVHGIAKSLT